ncbi:MAG: ribonuclease III [Christensenellales bacterium]|jgi:ribonuclease-3
MGKLEELQSRIGYAFQNRALLKMALTHTSYGSPSHNQRLEFLGDAVLGLYAANELYRSCPGMKEGEMTRVRAASVCESALFENAGAFSLGEYLYLGKGEELGGGRQKPSIVADAFEALTAAIYLDGGAEAAFAFARRFVPIRVRANERVIDCKTRLQEVLQKNGTADIRYELVDERGLDHNKWFVCEVLKDGCSLGRGEGRTKKEAEQKAAKQALERLSEQGEN